MTWRTIPFQRYDPYLKTGLNDAALQTASEGRHTFWLAGWDRPCINIGRSQRVTDQIDLEAARKDDITIVRRQGGGGTMYLTPEGELTWGMAIPAEDAPEEIEELYSQVCSTVASALGEIGISARHEPINDVITQKGKISGATARRRDGGVYIGGTLLFSIDTEEMMTYLTPDEGKTADKAIEDQEQRVTSITDHVDVTFEDVKTTLREAFLDGKETVTGDWTAAERQLAQEKAQTYRSNDWIFMHE